MTATFELRKTGPCSFAFSLNAQDGRLLLTSGAYPDKETALRRINATHSLVRNKKNYVILTAENGLSYFVIKNARGSYRVRLLTCTATNAVRCKCRRQKPVLSEVEGNTGSSRKA